MNIALMNYSQARHIIGWGASIHDIRWFLATFNLPTLKFLINVHGRPLIFGKKSTMDSLIRPWTFIKFWLLHKKCLQIVVIQAIYSTELMTSMNNYTLECGPSTNCLHFWNVKKKSTFFDTVCSLWDWKIFSLFYSVWKQLTVVWGGFFELD